MACKRVSLVLLFAFSACSSGGDGYSSLPTAMDFGAVAADIGGPGDLNEAGNPDLALSSPADLTVSTPADLSSPPDLTLPCLPGHYTGPVTAVLTTPIGQIMVVGITDLTVAAPQGAMLAVTGTMTASADGGNETASASVSGTIDCSQLQMTGTLSNGTASALVMGQTFTLPFTGTVAATYDTAQVALTNGTLTTMGLVGSGTWSASHQ